MHDPLDRYSLPAALHRRVGAVDSPLVGFYERRDRRFATVSHAELVGEAAGLAIWLRAEGVAPTTPLVIAQSRPHDVLVTFLGSVLAGAVPAVTATRPAFDPPAVTSERLGRVVATVGPMVVVVVDPARAAGLRGLPAGVRVLEAPDSLATGDPGPLLERSINPDEICYIQLTSGSTALPKALAVSHANLAANTWATVSTCGFTPADRLVSWLPLYHDMGLVGQVLLALCTGMDLHLMAPYDFLADPLSWLHAISSTRATISASPTFGYELVTARLEQAPAEDLDLSSWRFAYLGAEPISMRVAQRAARTLGRYGLPADALRGTYGMAEATLLAAVTPTFRALHGVVVEPLPFVPGDKVRILGEVELSDPIPEGAVVVAASGSPVLDTELWLLDDEGIQVDADDVCGEIHLAGPQVAAGVLTPDGLDPSGGAVATGDMGFMHDGEIYVVDRIKNIIIRRGVNHAVTPIEEALADAGELERRRVMVIDSDLTPGSGRVTALAEVPRGADADALADTLTPTALTAEPPIEDLVLVRWGSLPATTSGKKRHGEARRLLNAGELKVIEARAVIPAAPPGPFGAAGREAPGGGPVGATAAAPELDLDMVDLIHRVERLAQNIAQARGFSGTVGAHHRFTADLLYDSLALYELAMAVEDTSGILLPEEAIASVVTLGDLIELLRERRHRPATGDELGVAAAMALSVESLPQALLDIDTQEGRQLVVGRHRLIDFASCNYLGFDVHPGIVDSIAPMVRQWGVHPSWTRAVASPEPYRRLERRLAELVGAPDVIVFPTLTLQHIGLLPLLASGGTLFIDSHAHHSLQEAAELCTARGIRLVQVDRHDTSAIDGQLADAAPGPKVLVVDGVYSTSGEVVDLPPLVALAERHDAQIYVDDAHGFGIIGEQPEPGAPWGHRGNGVVRWHGLGYERIVYAGGMSKAYSSMAAFVTVRSAEERRRFALASTAVYSGPVPVASLASSLAGLDVNEQEGDDLRAHLLDLTQRLIAGTRHVGFEVDNRIDFPIVTAVAGSMRNVKVACDIAWDHGILITPAAFPAAPLNRGGLRFTVTAANTAEDVDRALYCLAAVAAALGLEPGAGAISEATIRDRFNSGARGGS